MWHARWANTPRWQFFSGCAYHEDRQPCDATILVKLRHLLGEEGVEELLVKSFNVAVELKLPIKQSVLAPTDARSEAPTMNSR